MAKDSIKREIHIAKIMYLADYDWRGRNPMEGLGKAIQNERYEEAAGIMEAMKIIEKENLLTTDNK